MTAWRMLPPGQTAYVSLVYIEDLGEGARYYATVSKSNYVDTAIEIDRATFHQFCGEGLPIPLDNSSEDFVQLRELLETTKENKARCVFDD